MASNLEKMKTKRELVNKIKFLSETHTQLSQLMQDTGCSIHFDDDVSFRNKLIEASDILENIMLEED